MAFDDKISDVRRKIYEWIDWQIKNGVSRKSIYHALNWLAFSPASLEICQEFSRAANEIESVWVERNLKGEELEKQCKDSEAALLYEMNVAEQFEGSHPYDRLRIFYKYKNDVANLKRIQMAYERNVQIQDENLKKAFARDLAKKIGLPFA